MMRKILVCFLLLPVLLSGCNLSFGSAQPQVVTGTPGAPVNVTYVTATPFFEPTATPTPAPTVPPDRELQAADRALLNGDNSAAIALFQAVLTQPTEAVSAEIRAAAAYGLGDAALREGMFTDAAAALTDFLAQYPTDVRAPWAIFLRGSAYLGLSQWQAAIADFQQYLALRPGVIDSYVYERIADAYFGLGMIPEALQSYEQAIAAGRSNVPLLALRERVAQAYLNTAQPQAALAQYDAILAVAENAGYRAEIMFLAGQALQAAGDNPSAYARYRDLLVAYPETDYAYQALRILLSARQPVDSLARGRASFAAEDYQDAITAFHAFTSEQAATGIPVDVYLLLGRAYRAMSNFAAARTAFQTVIDLYPTSPEFGQAMLEQGRTLYLSGDTAAAVQHYLTFAATYPTLPEAPEALWRAGYLTATQLGQELDAQAIFEQLGRDYPGNEWALQGLLQAGTAASNRGDLASAERIFAALGATGSGEQAAAAYLWLGKLAQRTGRADQSVQAFQAAAAADPGGYFSIRAEDLLSGRAPFQPPASYRWEFDDQLELGQAEDWLRSTFGITQAEALWPLSPTLAANPRAVAGRELWALQLFTQASEEFTSLLEQYRDDPLASYQLAIWLRGLGAYPESIVGAANVIRRANIDTLQAPPYLARMRYPIFYRDLVIQAAQERGLDPLLLFALIRQESLFDRYATAAAGEKGLTQVIPSTGDYIAGQLNWPDYQHTDLFRPYASVAFGAYYLWEQLSRFNFNVVAGLAGYNAGPGWASEWLAASGGDPDLFMEAISIDGARRYVQLIYEHYNIYRRLYGAG